MTTFLICAAISLALWVGGLTLFVGVVIPVAFRSFQKEEAGRFLEPQFPAVDRWGLVWGTVTVGMMLLLFLKRHFHLGSLVLEVPVIIMYLLTLHIAVILHPQVHELKRKLGLPEFQGTAHQQTIRFAFERMHRISVRLHALILALGLLSLGLTPRFLK